MGHRTDRDADFPFLEIPNWIVRLVVVLIAIGFPIALIIAWAFEITPEGIKRPEDVDLAVRRAPRKHTPDTSYGALSALLPAASA
jgi:hypothetical protein